MVKALDLSSNGRMSAWVRTPLQASSRFAFRLATIVNSSVLKYSDHIGFKFIKITPYGIQTHNLQIRSLTRCSIAPTGRKEFKCAN